MKTFVFLFRQVQAALECIRFSNEGFTPEDLDFAWESLRRMVTEAYDQNKVTEYQMKLLLDYAIEILNN